MMLRSLFTLFATATLAVAQTYQGLTLDSDGKVAAPSGFWTLNAADIRLSLNLGIADISGLQTALNAKAPAVVYAVFDIPLGGSFTDFELKATTANWAGGNMVYFYHSPDPDKSSITGQVWTVRPDVYFTDSQYVNPGDTSQNQRTWRKQSATQAIADMRANGNSVVAGVTVVVLDTGTISPSNTDLVWSYCRLTPTDYEKDGGGKSIWFPITPKWVSAPFTP